MHPWRKLLRGLKHRTLRSLIPTWSCRGKRHQAKAFKIPCEPVACPVPARSVAAVNFQAEEVGVAEGVAAEQPTVAWRCSRILKGWISRVISSAFMLR